MHSKMSRIFKTLKWDTKGKKNSERSLTLFLGTFIEGRSCGVQPLLQEIGGHVDLLLPRHVHCVNTQVWGNNMIIITYIICKSPFLARGYSHRAIQLLTYTAHIHARTHTHTHMHARTHMCPHKNMHVCACGCMCLRVHVCVHVCVHACVCVCVCVHQRL